MITISDAGDDPSLPSRMDMIRLCVEMMHLRETGAFDQLKSFYTEDCELVLPGAPGLTPLAGSFKGPDACIKAQQDYFTLFETRDITPTNFIRNGDAMMFTWTGSVRNRGTGPMLTMNGMATVKFRGTKVYFYSNYLDTAALAALAGYSLNRTRQA